MLVQFPDIAEKLNSISYKDQEDIALDEGEERKKRVSENTQILKDIIEQIGWPTRSKVGEEASNVAWILAQHSDYDHQFQKDCLDLMQKAESGEVKLKHIAYLIDRTYKNEGKPQLYGTQFESNWELWKVEDPDNLDQRRTKIGLSPVKEYIKQSKKFFEEENNR